MKKILFLILSVMISFLFVACENDISKVTISADPTEPVLADLSITADFTMANADEAITFTWDAAAFGFQSSTTYNLEIAPVSDFSANVATLISTQSLTGTTTIADLNGILLSWDKAIGENADMYYRVSASVTSDVIVYSETKSYTFVPFETLVDYPMIYVPGAYQGWSPGADNGRLYSYGFNSTYQGVLRIKDGDNANVEFKVTINPNWDGPNYGGSLTQTGANYAGTLDEAGGNFSVAAGVYEFTVDVNTLAIALSATNDWGMIGDATAGGWDSDTDMMYNGQRKMWEITTDLAAGQIKFRANDDWSLNYGDTGADGSLEEGGDNIVIAEAGNYTIRFSTEKLTYKIIKN